MSDQAPPAPPAVPPAAPHSSVPHVAAGPGMDTPPPVAAPPVAEKPPIPLWQQRATKAVGIIVALIGIVLGSTGLLEVFKGSSSNTLPACDSKTTLDVIRSIFKEKNLD